jgi:Domain of unknown function (DUF4328)
VEFRPVRERAKWAIIAIAAVAVIDVVAVWSGLDRYDLLGRIANGGNFTLDEANSSDNQETAIALLQILALIFGGVFFIRWFLDAYRNVNPLGGSRDFTEKWAGWAWFVPFLNLWRPKQIANDIWRASDPEHANEIPRDDAPVWGVVTLWWAFWLAANFGSQIAARIAFSGDSAESLRNATAAYLVGDSIDIVAAVLAIVVIRRITARQEERAARRAVPASA